MDGKFPQVWIQCSPTQQFPSVLDEVSFILYRHLKLRKEVLNISNIPALTDIKSNFRIYGKARVLEDEKAGAYYEEERNNYQ